MSHGVVACRNFEPELRAALEAEGLGGSTVVLFRGACEGGLPEAPVQGAEEGLVRLFGDCAGRIGQGAGFDSCFSMLVGQALVDEFMGQGLHLLTPTMVRAWNDARRLWGFTEDQIRAFFGESIRGFRVIDCGVRPLAPRDLETIARETGLPVDVWPATLDHLRAILRQVLAPVPEAVLASAPPSETRLLGDYAMAYDLLGRMVALEDEEQVIREIANLFLMLCAPGQVVLDLEARGGKLARRLTLPEEREPAPAGGEPSGTFELELCHEGTRLGTLRVEDLAFPARRDHYLRLGVLLAPMLSLILANVRTRGQLLASIVEFSDDAILSKTLDGTVTSWNRAACRIFGYTAEEAIGGPLARLVPADRLEEEANILSRIRQGVPVQHIETVRVRKDGTPVHVSVTISPIRDSSGAVIGASKICRDISGRKRAEAEKAELQEQLQQSNKMESLGRLAGGIAHDMNNVLAAVFAVTEFLQARFGDNAVLSENLTILEKAAQRGRDLVKGLVGFARKEQMAIVPIDVNALVRQEIALLERTLRQKFQLVVDLKEPLPLIPGEAGTLGSALMNLCVNAVDAMPDGGTLGIRTRLLDNGSVQLVVEDTGLGMSPNVLKHAMEPFFTTKPPGKGTGLGLSMVFNTVKAHGGTFSINSQEGKGTQMVLTFPVAAAEAGEDAASGQQPPLASTLKILLVDDDELIRSTVPLMLETLGHQVEAVDGGRAALDHLSRVGIPDLVVLDLNMPDMTGAETLRHIRARFRDLPVLLATGFADAEVERMAEIDPNMQILAKPYSFDEIKRKFDQLTAPGSLRSNSVARAGIDAPPLDPHGSVPFSAS